MDIIRKKRKPMAEINVVPYIDVMLVLLIIFMVTAPLLSTGVSVDLPQAASEPLENNDEEPFVVTVDADGRYYLNDDEEEVATAREIELKARALAEREEYAEALALYTALPEEAQRASAEAMGALEAQVAFKQEAEQVLARVAELRARVASATGPTAAERSASAA